MHLKYLSPRSLSFKYGLIFFSFWVFRFLYSYDKTINVFNRIVSQLYVILARCPGPARRASAMFSNHFPSKSLGNALWTNTNFVRYYAVHWHWYENTTLSSLVWLKTKHEIRWKPFAVSYNRWCYVQYLITFFYY